MCSKLRGKFSRGNRVCSKFRSEFEGQLSFERETGHEVSKFRRGNVGMKQVLKGEQGMK